MGRTLSPKVAALLVGVVLVAVVGVALAGNFIGGTGQPGPTGTPVATASVSANPSQIAANPSATPDPDAFPTPYPTSSGPPRKRALADREVFGFLPYWKLGVADTQVPLDLLTTVAIFGVEAGKNGTLVRQTAAGAQPPGWKAWQSDTAAQLIRDAHAKHVRVVLTIQRFAWTAPQARRTVALLSDPQARSTLAHEIAREITDHGADGVNLDFEPVPSEVRDDFTSLVRELRTQLDAAKAGLQITFDTTTGVGGWDLPALTADDAADAALIMGYDYRTAGARSAGSVDPVASTTAGGLLDTLDAVLAQISPDRTILALPWYGRAWSTISDQPDSGTQDQATYGNSVATEYADAIALARQYGRNYDATEGSAWTAYRKKDCATCPETWRQLWYDDVDSMQAKQKLAIERGLRGLGIWALGDDAALPEAWTTVRLSLGGRPDSKAPTGTAKVDPTAVSRKHGNLPVIEGTTLALKLTAEDNSQGTGVVLVRVSATSELADDTTLASDQGRLLFGITYPSGPSQTVPLADQRLGNGFAKGESTVFVQWRDIAGNWSAPVSVNFWLSTAVSVAPSPLPSSGD